MKLAPTCCACACAAARPWLPHHKCHTLPTCKAVHGACSVWYCWQIYGLCEHRLAPRDLTLSPAQIYYIWYGNWGNLANNGTAALPTTVKVLTDMAQSMGGKPWFNIVTTYYDNAGKVPNKVTYGGKAAVSASSSCYTVRKPNLKACS